MATTPSAGMTRIRFIGSFASGKPLSPIGLPVVTEHSKAQFVQHKAISDPVYACGLAAPLPEG